MSVLEQAQALLENADATLDELHGMLRRVQELDSDKVKAKIEVIEKIRKRIEREVRSFLEQPDHPVLEVAKAVNTGLRPVAGLRKQGPSIGDVNLAIKPVDITESPFTEAVFDVAFKLVEQTGGRAPTLMDKRFVVTNQGPDRRVVVQWRITGYIDERDLRGIYQLVAKAYSDMVHGLKTSGQGGWETCNARALEDGKRESKIRGIFIGSDNGYYNTSSGVFVGRQFDSAHEAEHLRRQHPFDWVSWSHSPKHKKKKETLIELRDCGQRRRSSNGKLDLTGLSQEWFLWLVTQISSLLRRRKFIDSEALFAEIFRRLNRIGTRDISREQLFGLESVLEEVENIMLMQILKPKQSEWHTVEAESVVLVGVPGVGKTSLEYHLMHHVPDMLFIAVDAEMLRADLDRMSSDHSEGSEILIRLDFVHTVTGLPICLIVDDIDVVATEKLTSKLLNLMQGIRQMDFLILSSTNYPERIDDRLREPGRLARMVHMGLPDRATRVGVLKTHLAYRHCSEDEQSIILEWAGDNTEEWTHRFLWELLNDAARFASREDSDTLRLTHVQKAHAYLDPVVKSKRLKEWDERIGTVVKETRVRIGMRA